MKIRSGYVSNSSSSSFILRGQEDLAKFKEVFKDRNPKVFSVKEIRALFVDYYSHYLIMSRKELEEYNKKIQENLPFFIYWNYFDNYFDNDLDNIKSTFFSGNLGEDDYITEEIDRNYISEFIGRVDFEEFEEI